ncbi:MAG: hypothetical protein Nk1A_7430 [Endomicrobiia bacterium]|nr:MAG: hypothetical protein Nk1A_7430 [Endomicrobiia bacterium]
MKKAVLMLSLLSLVIFYSDLDARRSKSKQCCRDYAKEAFREEVIRITNKLFKEKKELPILLEGPWPGGGDSGNENEDGDDEEEGSEDEEGDDEEEGSEDEEGDDEEEGSEDEEGDDEEGAASGGNEDEEGDDEEGAASGGNENEDGDKDRQDAEAEKARLESEAETYRVEKDLNDREVNRFSRYDDETKMLFDIEESFDEKDVGHSFADIQGNVDGLGVDYGSMTFDNGITRKWIGRRIEGHPNLYRNDREDSDGKSYRVYTSFAWDEESQSYKLVSYEKYLISEDEEGDNSEGAASGGNENKDKNNSEGAASGGNENEDKNNSEGAASGGNESEGDKNKDGSSGNENNDK